MPPRKKNDVPFYVKNLPSILLVICSLHLIADCILLKHQYPSVFVNETNTHFGLTCVMVFLLCLLISLVIVDILFRTHSTFRYVIGLNISVVASGLFISGYLIGHIIEISFAQVTVWSTCRQLGIGTYLNVSFPENSTVLSSDDIEQSEKARCDEAVSLAFHDISIDLLINIFFLPLHIASTAFSWTFSGLYRPRLHGYYD